MARPRARHFGGGSKRHGEWVGSSPQTSLTGLAASSVVLDQVFTPFDAGETIIRTRGLFAVKTDQIATTENQMGAVGLGVVSEQAATVGITAVPHPDTDSGWNGWLWHSYWVASFTFGSAVGFTSPSLSQVIIDSKAMRKVGDNERVVLVVENSSAVGIQFYSSVRIYSKPF